MGLNLKDIKVHGAEASYGNIEGVGNVVLDKIKKEVRLTLKPNLFISEDYKKEDNSTPLNAQQGTHYEDVIMDGIDYESIMTVLYSAWKKKKDYITATDA